MKKLYLVCLVLFYAAPFLKSQTYHPLVDEGKRWSARHIFSPTGTIYSDYTEFEGDTLIGLYAYKHVWQYTDEAMTQKYLDGFIREDLAQKKVFMRYTDVAEDFLLYDFGAEEGDTLFLHYNPNPYVLDSIQTVTLLSGEQRRSFNLHSNFVYPCTETWIEGIGSISKGVLNSGSCGFVGDDPRMLCAWENDTLKYHNPDYSYCFVITGTGELPSQEPVVGVFPNPASTGINVEIRSGTEPLQFEITDLTGRIMQSCDLVSKNSRIDLDKHVFSPGIYLYRVRSGNAILTTGKLTVL